ncbi:MAG: MCE family protein, partial [Solirubrobacterales bacterium]|nr:MCE family protein [Solirubrobacterales bacterium]
MRRALLTLLVVLGAGALVVLTTGAGGDSGASKYTVELDNAFGLIEGADVKVSGVRAGKIAAMRLDRESGAYRALVDIEINEQGFGDLRADAFCETRPQSLIGEYFVDCKPGSSPRRLRDGATIAVERTGSTVPVDLVNSIMRRPYRERFSILLSELGAGLAARGPELNETIRRASPALRETDRVLAVLRDQRRIIRDLYGDADRVLDALADDRGEVSRFVVEARDTAKASASRREDLAGQFRRLPTFLRELRPTMRLLGQAAERQAPALAGLQANSGLLRRFLDDLGPFAEGSRPAFRTLGDAARTGRGAVRSSRPNIAELRRGVRPAPEAADNLAITLEHLDDPEFAVEKDPRSPRGGKGYTGLEALLRYIHNQSQATNLFDANGYLLKVAPFLDNTCAPYADAEAAKDPKLDRCAAILGPVRPGINTPDPTKGAKPAARRKRRAARERGRRA